MSSILLIPLCFCYSLELERLYRRLLGDLDLLGGGDLRRTGGDRRLGGGGLDKKEQQKALTFQK